MDERPSTHSNAKAKLGTAAPSALSEANEEAVVLAPSEPSLVSDAAELSVSDSPPRELPKKEAHLACVKLPPTGGSGRRAHPLPAASRRTGTSGLENLSHALVLHRCRSSTLALVDALIASTERVQYAQSDSSECLKTESMVSAYMPSGGPFFLCGHTCSS